jgi:hypothetical protein
MQEALRRVGEKRRVSAEEAGRLGFAIDAAGEDGLKPDADGQVVIPAWRHAIINFPHPLLQQGLVILDTPGLNAIGAEPELTLSLLPSAHAILFILGADTGVTQSDLAVWRDHVNGARTRQKGRIAVLNKIDGLWDGLRSEREIEAEIASQVTACSQILELPADHIFPVSAQKGLVAKVNGDHKLLGRSRLPELERALSRELIPAKQEIVCDDTEAEVGDVISRTRRLLDARLGGVKEQLLELNDLRGKNEAVIAYMMRKVKQEKDDFDQGLQRFYAVRSVFSNLTNRLFTHLGMDAVRDATRRTREGMLAAMFSKGMREAMTGFFEDIRANLRRSNDDIAEIVGMMEAMYTRFSTEHGLKLGAPVAFSLLRYEKEIGRLEQVCASQFNNFLNLVTHAQRNLTRRFFETIALQVRKIFEQANRDADHWLRAVMAPLETQVREYQLQLKRRLESVKRIHQATDTLEERIRELTHMRLGLEAQLAELDRLAEDLHRNLRAAEGLPGQDALAA